MASRRKPYKHNQYPSPAFLTCQRFCAHCRQRHAAARAAKHTLLLTWFGATVATPLPRGSGNGAQRAAGMPHFTHKGMRRSAAT